ncbi:hypothetical protein DFH07DRAFT_777744 [Mycena maculata]|uniref:Uncharacterized protein n=1 Tax=Mycena maculata TaxID=230809 RepID=A0AAD7IIA5_9AGAR|nr:hypothetical protein DFH07DRAFT_777744 [Mycena maculata]
MRAGSTSRPASPPGSHDADFLENDADAPSSALLSVPAPPCSPPPSRPLHYFNNPSFNPPEVLLYPAPTLNESQADIHSTPCIVHGGPFNAVFRSWMGKLVHARAVIMMGIGSGPAGMQSTMCIAHSHGVMASSPPPPSAVIRFCIPHSRRAHLPDYDFMVRQNSKIRLVHYTYKIIIQPSSSSRTYIPLKFCFLLLQIGLAGTVICVRMHWNSPDRISGLPPPRGIGATASPPDIAWRDVDRTVGPLWIPRLPAGGDDVGFGLMCNAASGLLELECFGSALRETADGKSMVGGSPQGGSFGLPRDAASGPLERSASGWLCARPRMGSALEKPWAVEAHEDGEHKGKVWAVGVPMSSCPKCRLCAEPSGLLELDCFELNGNAATSGLVTFLAVYPGARSVSTRTLVAYLGLSHQHICFLLSLSALRTLIPRGVVCRLGILAVSPVIHDSGAALRGSLIPRGCTAHDNSPACHFAGSVALLAYGELVAIQPLPRKSRSKSDSFGRKCNLVDETLRNSGAAKSALGGQFSGGPRETYTRTCFWWRKRSQSGVKDAVETTWSDSVSGKMDDVVERVVERIIDERVARIKRSGRTGTRARIGAGRSRRAACRVAIRSRPLCSSAGSSAAYASGGDFWHAPSADFAGISAWVERLARSRFSTETDGDKAKAKSQGQNVHRTLGKTPGPSQGLATARK